MAILLHAVIDAFVFARLFASPQAVELGLIIGLGALALLLVFVTGARLGYQPADLERSGVSRPVM